jgi:shikimate kinase
MPGSGKTTLGKQLAKSKSMKFIDLDAYIEQKTDKKIPEIFRDFGEDTFRQIEREVVLESINWKNTIVATGGGAPCFFDSMDVINQSGTSVFIDVSAKELFRRIIGKGQDKRPLLASIDQNELLQNITNKRETRLNWYKKAHYTLSSDNANAKELSDIIDKQK